MFSYTGQPLNEMQIRASALEMAMRLCATREQPNADLVICEAEKILNWIKSDAPRAPVVSLVGDGHYVVQQPA
jgi:hypothetical protein